LSLSTDEGSRSLLVDIQNAVAKLNANQPIKGRVPSSYCDCPLGGTRVRQISRLFVEFHANVKT